MYDFDFNCAAKILPVVKNQHLLLCTLLIGNALAMEVSYSFFPFFYLVMVCKEACSFSTEYRCVQALPIFLDELVNAWGAILISVTLILMFGEVDFLMWVYN